MTVTIRPAWPDDRGEILRLLAAFKGEPDWLPHHLDHAGMEWLARG